MRMVAGPGESTEGIKMSNPFEAVDKQYLVLVNHEGQHSLWPAGIRIPAGWTTVFGADQRSACLEFVNANWTDMRPKSLIAAMGG
jgi:MbtH protein